MGQRVRISRSMDHMASRAGHPDEVHCDTLSIDPFARLSLALMRLHFLNFAEPDRHGWLMALRVASAHVGPRRAGGLSYDIVAVVQSLRMARKSTVSFNSETCACCRVWLGPDERRLMGLLDAVRHGRMGPARIMTQLLCDGEQDAALLASVADLLTHNAPNFETTT